jgi:ATP-binding cassette subfamily G (WHITE) protein 2 (PDR)
LLYEGRQIYFGHKDSAKRYFIDMGFVCPDRQATPDFFTSLTNPAERIVAKSYENKVPRTADDFAARWKNSQSRQRLLQDINDYEAEYPVDGHHLDQFRASRKAAQAKGIRAKSPYPIYWRNPHFLAYGLPAYYTSIGLGASRGAPHQNQHLGSP